MTCVVCGGKGRHPSPGGKICLTCQGRGTILETEKTEQEFKCPYCDITFNDKEACIAHVQLRHPTEHANYPKQFKQLVDIEVPKDVVVSKSGAKTSGDFPPYECLTLIFLRRCARRMGLGIHYGKHNWKQGAKDREYVLERLNHAMEHLIKLQAEIDTGVIDLDDNAAAVAVNVMMAMEYQEWFKLQDTPKPAQVY